MEAKEKQIGPKSQQGEDGRSGKGRVQSNLKVHMEVERGSNVRESA